MKLIIAILLALLPFISWIIQYLVSKKNGLINSFKNHWTCYYGDWIFVIINFVFIYSVEISNKLWSILLISFIINIFTHSIWGNKNKSNKLDGHFFYNKKNKLNFAGISHLIFSTIQMVIIISILFLKPIIPIIFIELLFVLLFGIVIIYGSYKIHSKINKIDLIASLILIVLVLSKIVFLLN
jgi:hypothetical protein